MRTRLLYRLAALAAALSAALSQPAFAAGSDDLQFFEEEATVVAAARHPQKQAETPANTYVITRDEIERYNYRTLAEALQSVPGIYFRYDHNYTYIWVRGFGRPGDYNSRVLVMIDGHRMNDNVYGEANYDHLFSLDLRSVDHIEVVKGPGSALYGDNALLAVVNVVTIRAKNAPKVQASAEGGSWGTTKEFLGLSRKFNNDVEAYAAGSYYYSYGQKNLSYPEFGGINGGIAQNADREEAYNLFGRVGTPDLNLTGNFVNRSKTVPTAPFNTDFDVTGTHTVDSRSYIELKGGHDLPQDVRLDARAYYDWSWYYADYIGTQTSATTTNYDASRADWYGEEVTARWTQFGERNALLVGQDVEETVRAHQLNYDEVPYALNTDDSRNLYRWAFFAQQELHPRDDLDLNAGVRYDHYKTFGGTVNPRAAMIYRPWNNGSVKLLYGTAFRAPTVFELYYTDGYIPNPNLQPERIQTYEAAYEHDFSRGVWGSVSYFQSRFRDLIDAVNVNPTTITYVNEGHVRTDGVELASKWEAPWDISGHAGYTLQWTRDTSTGETLDNSPRQVGNVGLSHRLRLIRDTHISGEMFVISKNTTLMDTTNPAAAIFSFNLRSQPWVKGPIFFAGVHNLFNIDYRLSAAPEHLEAAIPQNGRDFNAGLEYRFE